MVSIVVERRPRSLPARPTAARYHVQADTGAEHLGPVWPAEEVVAAVRSAAIGIGGGSLCGRAYADRETSDHRSIGVTGGAGAACACRTQSRVRRWRRRRSLATRRI